MIFSSDTSSADLNTFAAARWHLHLQLAAVQHAFQPGAPKRPSPLAQPIGSGGA